MRQRRNLISKSSDLKRMQAYKERLHPSIFREPNFGGYCLTMPVKYVNLVFEIVTGLFFMH